MADLSLSQAEADTLIAMEKHRANDVRYLYPPPGYSLILPLHAPQKREQFLLDISRGRIELSRGKYQSRARQVIVLVRLDFGGPPHRNPNDEEIPCPHIHIYKEGYADKWAEPLPSEHFSQIDDRWKTMEDFLHFCNITEPPYIDRGLFT